jgi:hypothetical protein
LEVLVERLRTDGGVLLRFAAERLRHPELAAEFDRSVVGAKRAHVHRLVTAAVARGELPAGTDVELVAELGPALIWHRALHGWPLPADLVARVLDIILPSPPPRARPRR